MYHKEGSGIVSKFHDERYRKYKFIDKYVLGRMVQSFNLIFLWRSYEETYDISVEIQMMIQWSNHMMMSSCRSDSFRLIIMD